MTDKEKIKKLEKDKEALFECCKGLLELANLNFDALLKCAIASPKTVSLYYDARDSILRNIATIKEGLEIRD